MFNYKDNARRQLIINISLHYKIRRFHVDVHVHGPEPHHTHSSGFRKTVSISASRDPLAGSCMYSHLRTERYSYQATQTAHYRDTKEQWTGAAFTWR